MYPNADNITSELAMLPDPALKQMALMHQSDPYMLPLIISEDTRRKQTRAAAQGMGQPQPKVVEQAIAGIGQMPVPQAPQALPLQQPGMGQPAQRAAAPPPQGPQARQAPGIAGLPAPNLAKFADGGIVGYAGGGEPDGSSTAGDANSLGEQRQRLMTDIASIQRELANLERSGMPTDKKAAATQALQIELQRNQARLAQVNQGKSAFADALPMGTANARVPTRFGSPLADLIPGTSWGPQNRSSADQIPETKWGSQNGAPPVPEEPSVWAQLADKLGISPDAQRNINNSVNAVAPLSIPAAGAVNGIQALAAQRGVQSSNVLGNALKASTLTPALTNPATPSKLGENVAQTISADMGGGVKALLPDAAAGANDAFRKSERDLTNQQAGALPQPNLPSSNAIAAAAEAVTPPEKRKGMSKDDYLMLGLQLMANRSPRFLTALGESGIATLQARNARDKMALDERRGAADIDKDTASAEYYRAHAKSLGINNKDLTAALKAGNDAYDDWAKSLEGMTEMSGARKDAKRQEFIARAMAQYGVALPAGALPAYAPVPAGVKVTREK